MKMNVPSSPRGRPVIEVPWGADGLLELNLPEAGVFDAMPNVFRPDLGGAVANYESVLENALASPMNSEPLDRLVKPGGTVAIVVDDPSRWTPVSDALPIILRRLHGAGLTSDEITISVGVGRHHAVDAPTMARRVGPSIAGKYRCFSPPVDDLSAYVDLGTTSEGIPLRVFRPVAEAGLRILVGSVLPHLQAGFGGGLKLILPGTSHRTTLGALHRQGLEPGSDASRLMGSYAHANPMRRAIQSAAGRIGPCYSVSHLIGAPGQIFEIVTGDPARVQDRIALNVRRRFQAPYAGEADVVVVGNNPWPGDPMQSFKTLLHHRAASKSGGILIGLFWTDRDEIDRSFPMRAMKSIAVTGLPGGWAIRRVLPWAQRMAEQRELPASFMLRWACELVVDRTVLVYSPPLHERIGPRLGPIRIFADQEKLWQIVTRALNRLGGSVDPPRMQVYPVGGLSYVSAPDADQ